MDQVIDEYLTLAGRSEARLKIKGSVFLAIAVPVESVTHGDELLTGWRRKYHDATHIGWARRLAPPPDGEVRWDDDGEPRGSTGPPILQAITGADLWNVQIGVVRWFGGTKLGIGGLARAYGATATGAVRTGKIRTIEVTRTIRVTIPGDRISSVYALADHSGAYPDPPEFTGGLMSLMIHVRASRAETLADELVEGTAGRARVEILP